ncbi:unnamed protein product, partial [Ilex paraguariensis]
MVMGETAAILGQQSEDIAGNNANMMNTGLLKNCTQQGVVGHGDTPTSRKQRKKK